MTRSEYSILGVTVVGHCLCHWSVLIVTGLLVTLRAEFNLTEFWVTALPLTGYVLMGVGAVPAGMMTDRWGARTVLLIYFVLTGLACIAAGAASSAWMLSVALAALGAAVSLYHPTGLAMISHGIRQRGQALGIHGMAGSLGLAGSSFGLWMASMGSWRAAYAIVGTVALACALALWLLPIHVARPEPMTGPAKQEKNANVPTFDRSVAKLLVLLYVAMMLSGFNYRSVMTALPTYLTAIKPGEYAGKGMSGAVLAVFLVGGLGQFLAGRFADRASAVRLYVCLVAISVPMALLLA